jgi:hypothetical protein
MPGLFERLDISLSANFGGTDKTNYTYCENKTRGLPDKAQLLPLQHLSIMEFVCQQRLLAIPE